MGQWVPRPHNAVVLHYVLSSATWRFITSDVLHVRGAYVAKKTACVLEQLFWSICIWNGILSSLLHNILLTCFASTERSSLHTLPYSVYIFLHEGSKPELWSQSRRPFFHGNRNKVASRILLGTCFHPGSLLRLLFGPWRWRRYVTPRRQLTLNELHGVISQMMVRFRFFSIPQRPYLLWGPPSLLYNGYWGGGGSPEVKRPGVWRCPRTSS
jgi:hypothetical protein